MSKSAQELAAQILTAAVSPHTFEGSDSGEHLGGQLAIAYRLLYSEINAVDKRVARERAASLDS